MKYQGHRQLREHVEQKYSTDVGGGRVEESSYTTLKGN